MYKMVAKLRKVDVRLVFSVIEYTLIVSLDQDFEAGIDQLLGSCGCQRSATFELLLLAAQPETWSRHCGRR